jgi:hypothetical protein
MGVMVHTANSNTNWHTIKIRKKLVEKIQRIIKNEQKHGIPKYDSITDFVQTACLKLLELEETKEIVA